jgi:hypothetical protein
VVLSPGGPQLLAHKRHHLVLVQIAALAHAGYTRAQVVGADCAIDDLTSLRCASAAFARRIAATSASRSMLMCSHIATRARQSVRLAVAHRRRPKLASPSRTAALLLHASVKQVAAAVGSALFQLVRTSSDPRGAPSLCSAWRSGSRPSGSRDHLGLCDPQTFLVKTTLSAVSRPNKAGDQAQKGDVEGR